MDKYLTPKSTSSAAGAKGTCSDLLSMMKNSNAPKAPPWSVPAAKENDTMNKKAVGNGWAQREATINSTTIKCNERTKSLNTDIKGWKVVDNQKVYTTFRNGKVVSASGFEGFKLSSGDKPKMKPTQDTSKDQQSLGTKRKASLDGEWNAENTGPNKSSARPKQQQQQELKW